MHSSQTHGLNADLLEGPPRDPCVKNEVAKKDTCEELRFRTQIKGFVDKSKQHKLKINGITVLLFKNLEIPYKHSRQLSLSFCSKTVKEEYAVIKIFFLLGAILKQVFHYFLMIAILTLSYNQQMAGIGPLCRKCFATGHKNFEAWI